MSVAMSSRVATLASILVFAVSQVRGDCYSHDGVAARASRYYTGPELVPCGNGSNTCCLPGQKCGSNLLCSKGSTLTREYCAKEDWQGCSSLASEVVEYGVTLTECGGNIVCYNNSSCCTNGGPTYYVDPRTGEVKDGTNKDGINTSPPTYWDFGSTSTSLAAASSTLVSQSTSAFTASSPTGDTTLGPDTAQKSSSLSAGAGAGIGIGCAAAVAGLAVLGWALLRRRRKNRVPQAQTDRPDGIFVHEYQDMGKTQSQSPTYHVHRNTQPQELDGGRRPQELQ